MGRRRRDGNHTPEKKYSIANQWEMKKMDIQFLTPKNND
jgi:hypothetical protein